MDKFIESKEKEKCHTLIKSHGEILDLERVAKKRYTASGCRNRFTVAAGKDIGLLSKDSYKKTTTGSCFAKEDLRFLGEFSQTGYIDPFTGGNLGTSDILNINLLNPSYDIVEGMERESIPYKRKFKPLQDMLENIGKGLTPPYEFHMISPEEEIRATHASRVIFFVLEKMGKIYLPKTVLPNIAGKFTERGTIEADDDTIRYNKKMVVELHKFGINKIPRAGKNRIVTIGVVVNKANHANILIIDRKKKEVFYLEPHGLKSSTTYIKDPMDFMKKFIQVFGLRDFKVIEVVENCPWFGPQSRESRLGYRTGYCQTWTELFAFCKAYFPDLSEPEIFEAMLGKRTPEQVRDLVERFAAFAWDQGKRAVFPGQNPLDFPYSVPATISDYRSIVSVKY